MNLRTVLKQGERLLKKHSPEILTGIGLVTIASSVVLAVKATPKALFVVEHEEIERAHPLTTKEKIEVAGKLYIPAAAAFVVGSACIIGASSIHLHRNAALAAAASLTDATFKSYRDVVTEKIGEEAEKDIHKDVAAKKMKEHVSDIQDAKIINLPHGDDTVWCYDPLVDRYFWYSINSINSAVNIFNRQMRYDVKLSVNEWFDTLGLDHAVLAEGLGWDIDTNGYLELTFDSRLDRNGKPAMVLVYTNPPIYIGL